MIHLKVKFDDIVMAWLQDVTDGKDEMKFMFDALKEAAVQWLVPYMRLQTDKKLIIGDKTITPEQLKPVEMKDEEGGELVLGDKIVINLQNAYSILKVVNPNLINMDINEWARKVIIEKLIEKKADMEKEVMKYGDRK